MTRKPWLRLSILSFAVALGACGEEPVDLVENCAVTGDEDGNGDADCDDIECSLLAECQPRCGDGEVNVDGELCDDGNDIDGDGCDSDCSETGCGNGILTGDEVCDDGNAVESDGCDTNCTVSACGNDVVGTDEECDDANLVDGDGCDSDCSLTACGNGIQTKNEGCDDGNDVEGDGCDTNCTTSGCGNEVVDPTEACDDGNADSGDGCDANCTPTGCGNGVMTGTEACDDGNTMNNDGCSSTCVIECGNGQVTGMEECDGTNFLGQNCITRGYIGGTIACTSECRLDVSQCVSPGCPNNVLELGEDCEGTNLGGNTCTSIGQGFVGGTLACDNPTCEFDTDGCIAPGCGNTVLEVGEQCDDGDLDPGDGCDASCMIEGVISEIEPNEDGTPGVGGSGINGNDFNATAVINANNNGVRDVVAGDGLIAAAINPVGDEDVFAFSNSLAMAVQLRVDLYNFATGIGQPCGTTLNTGMHIRNAGGGSLASNDDRSGTADQCSGITYVVPAGTTVYVHTMEFGDNLAVASYGIRFDWTVPVCGNGARELSEQCDDGNTDAGDGCSATCTIEGVVGEVEGNNTTAEADASTVQITGDVLISGAITDGTDEADYFRITVAGTTIVRFETFSSLFDCDTTTTTTMRLRDNLGVEIISDTTTGIRSCSAISYPLEAGTYYLQIEESGTNATIPVYFLEAQFMDAAGAESEAANTSGVNDTRMTASANLVGLDEVYVFGDHSLSTDDDWYAITVPAGAAIRAEIIEGNRPIETCESNLIDADLTVFDAAGTQLADDDLSGRGYCALIDGTGSAPSYANLRNNTGSAATYYLRVQGYGTSATDANQFVYRLLVTLR